MEKQKSLPYQIFAAKSVMPEAKIKGDQALNTVSGLSYRIVSLLSARRGEEETVLAAFDKSESGGDFGRIQVMLRRSTDGGASFDEAKPILSLPVLKAPQKRGDYQSAFAIDPVLVQCKNGDILLMCDVYPECKGLMHRAWLENGSGYVTVGAKKYLALFEGNTKVGGKRKDRRPPFTVRENGFVYTPGGKKTNYYLPKNHNPEFNFETVGDLYYAVGEPDFIESCPPLIPKNESGTDIYCGNVFLSSNKGVFSLENPQRVEKKKVGPNGTGENFSDYDCVETKAAPLSVSVHNYLWVLRSGDMGKTWSAPIDITASVMENDDFFLGTTPGIGLCLENQRDESRNGRIVVPVYNLKKTFVVFSDDNGVTWKRSQSSKNIDETALAQTSDGTVCCFGRQRKLGKTPFSISRDGGMTWEKRPKTNLCGVKCQKSVIALPKEHYSGIMDKNKSYLIACATTGDGQKNSLRFGGVMTLGEYGENGQVNWLRQKKLKNSVVTGKNENFFAYSSLTVLKSGKIAVLYEALPTGLGLYDEISIDELLNGEQPLSFPIGARERILRKKAN